MRFPWHAPLLAMALGACVPHVEILGAPCPCPAGTVCCETTATCVASAAACPDHYPRSSGRPCGGDDACAANESCHAWTVSGALAGPQTCRATCSGDHPCSQGETCELALHGGFALDSLQVSRLCVPEAPAPRCEGRGCRQCQREHLARTYCDGAQARGCFVFLDPECGLSCESAVLWNCESAGGCDLKDGQARCAIPPPSSLCDQLSCAACEAGPDNSSCLGTQLVTCAALPFDECPGQQVCLRSLHPCSGQCLSEDVAHCAAP